MAKDKPISSMSFEEAMVALESIVREMESGKAPLEESITAYERGVALRAHCEQKLREAQEKIDLLVATADGKVTTQPFDSKE